jgi:hypothetical protein
VAKERWGTFSVEDHQSIRQLIPDILCFDRLVFPYPTDDEQRRYWETKQWEPDALDERLAQLGDLAQTFKWGTDEREEFSDRFAKSRDPRKLEIPWEYAKFITQDTIAAAMQRETGDSCWLMPRYGSLAAIQADRSIQLRPTERNKRRTRLSVLVGHELALPAGANPKAAFELALELARDASFQFARRELYRKQENTVLQEQSGENDAQEFADLVSSFNAQVTARTEHIEKGWIFTMLKGAKEFAEAFEKPFSSLFGAALEVAETATEDHDIEPGPVAVFHHVRKRVFDRASR